MKKLIVSVDDHGVYHVEGELIQCKDCRFFTGKWCVGNGVFLHELNICKSPDGYCDGAKRKEE